MSPDLFWHTRSDSAAGTFTLSVCSFAGDIDLDCVTTLADFGGFTDCVAGPSAVPDPQQQPTANECLAAFDFDDDGDNDLVDYAQLVLLLTQQ